MISQANVNNDKQDLVEEDLYDEDEKVKWYSNIVQNTPLKIILVVAIMGILVPVLLYQFIFVGSEDWPPHDGYSSGTCLLNRNSRLPCGIGPMPQESCHPQCCYDLNSNLCFHRFPSRFSYIFNQRWSENVTFVSRIPTIPYRNLPSTPAIKISIDEISSSHLSLAFYDAQSTTLSGNRLENKSYEYTLTPQELSITIDSAQGRIFDTIRGPLIASNEIWEIVFKLTNETMYGLGELPLQESMVKILYNHDGGLSSIPLIYAKSNGSYHGLLVDIKAPTEIIIGGENQVIVRALTGSGMKFHIFVGPKPSDVMNDARKLLGTPPRLEYWMLGAHICNEVEETPDEALEHLTNFTTAANQAQLPYESSCGAAPILLENKCLTNQSHSKYIDEGARLVKNANRRYVPHLSPYIRYEEFNNSDSENSTESRYRRVQGETRTELVDEEEVESCSEFLDDLEKYMLQDSNGVYKGKVGNDTVIYPTYDNVSEVFMQNFWPYSVELDGVVLENTWPLDEAVKDHSYAYSTLPYCNTNFEAAFNQTLLWNTIFPDGTVYFHKHNEYSNKFINAAKHQRDMPIWSTSQWLNGDVVINRQNVKTSWASFQRELNEAALGGISGHWLWSTPICGDTDHYNSTLQSELCLKWYLASTYMPMIKIHSKGEERHPLSFEGIERTIAINALRNRLTLLPYMFTVLQEGPLLRPMFYQFPDSDFLSNVTSQYSVGDDLLIVPRLLPNQDHVHVRVPPGTWFELWGGKKLAGEEGEIVKMTDTAGDILTYMRAGSIIVMQKNPSPTAEVTRLQAFLSLTIALESETLNVTDHENTTTVETYHAAGKFYINENLTLLFEADEIKLKVTAVGDDFAPLCSATAISNRFITELKIFGLPPERNNYDDYKQISAVVMLCNLETQPEVISVYT